LRRVDASEKLGTNTRFVSQSPSEPVGHSAGDAIASFCSNCGQAFSAADRFCAGCGSARGRPPIATPSNAPGSQPTTIEAMKDFDDHTYLKWFSWSLINLKGDLDAYHAAAEAACLAQASEKPVADIESSARHAGSRPRLVRPRQIAIAEWAFWAHTALSLDNDDSLDAAREAVVALESGNSLDTAKDLVRGRMPNSLPRQSTGAPLSDPHQVAANDLVDAKRNESGVDTQGTGQSNLPTSPIDGDQHAGIVTSTSEDLIGPAAHSLSMARHENGSLADDARPFYRRGVLVLVTVIAAVAVAIVLALFLAGNRAGPAISAKTDGSYIAVSLADFPANAVVYLFVDGTEDQPVWTDSSGAAQAGREAAVHISSGPFTVRTTAAIYGYGKPARRGMRAKLAASSPRWPQSGINQSLC